MYTLAQTVELLTGLVEDDQQVAIGKLGRNTVDTLNRLRTSNLKHDLEEVLSQLGAGRQRASDERLRTRWDCVVSVVDGYLFEHCLDPYRGDVSIGREPVVLGPVGTLTDLKGNTVALVDQRMEAGLKGVAESTVKHNLLSAILASAKPEDVEKAASELSRHSGQPPSGHTMGWPGVLFPVAVGMGVYYGLKNRMLEEYYWQTG